MKRTEFLKLAAFASLSTGFLLSACKKENKEMAGEAKKSYTCPMHPQIVQGSPGACPICAMDLVLVDKTSTDVSITLDESQRALANVTTLAAGSGVLQNTKRLNGRLLVNPDRTEIISSRIAGRIENLFVKQTGVPVRAGTPLYRIYSEQLLALQQEYLLADAQAREFPADARFAAILKAARQKLRLYDQREAAIDTLAERRVNDPFVTYHAPVDGVVAALSVTEGQYVAEGAPVLRLEDYASLWVEADFYPSEAGVVKQGQMVQVQISGADEKPVPMKIDFVTPAARTGSQLVQLRGTIPNPGNSLQPGLQANVLLPVGIPQKVITLPVDAVIHDAKNAHVWIETKPGTYAARKVTTGMQNAGEVEITEGIAPDERVVVTGAYLLYSEFVLKKGADPMAIHKH